MTTTSELFPASRGPADHDVRDQIVAAAAAHFSLYGYGKTTVSELARNIGYSKAYVYKFFESKQAIGEMICSGCLELIEAEVDAAIASADGRPPEQIRRMFAALESASQTMFDEDRKLYEIAIAAATEGWQAAKAYDGRIRDRIHVILTAGRASGDFERKTPLDELTTAVYLVMRTYFNPLLMQHSLGKLGDETRILSGLILRSLSP